MLFVSNSLHCRYTDIGNVHIHFEPILMEITLALHSEIVVRCALHVTFIMSNLI